MNKRHWIHVDAFGRHHRIGVMHGGESGNLMIYYNDKVIVIDFEIFESKSYKFFVDEELCEIFVIKHKKQQLFRYEFKYDHQTTTPLNIKRKAKIKKNNIKGLATMIAVPLLMFCLIVGYSYARKTYLEYQLQYNKIETWATVRVFQDHAIQKSYFFFKDNEEELFASKKVVNREPITPHGLPVENGDVFAVEYIDGHSFYYKINYDEPDLKTLSKLMNRVAVVHKKNHQGQTQIELWCEIKTAYELEGLKGLSKIYHQSKLPISNEYYNQRTFQSLVQDSNFRNVVEQCWDRNF